VILYYITDRKQFPGSETLQRSQLLNCIEEAASCEVDFIQLREKDLNARDLEALALAAKERVSLRNTRTKLLVNARTDIAIAAGADGVHLPAHDFPASEVRIVFNKAGYPQPVIAVSCHNLQEVELAEAHGADLVVFGPVFEKDNLFATRIDEFRLVNRRETSASSKMPVLALGGVNLANASACMEAGAAGLAGIRLFQAGEMGKTVAALRALSSESIKTVRRRHPYQPG
jgi:thiamine-phosphate pyrophosphorylase